MAFTRYADAAKAFDVINGPRVADVGLSGARQRVSKGNLALETVDFDTGGKQIALAPIPTNARLESIGIQSDNLGGTFTANFGLYDTDDARTEIGEGIYATNVSVDALPPPTGAVTSVRADFRWELSSLNLNQMGQRVWEDAGLTADPGTTWLLTLTVQAASSEVAGDLAFIVRWTLD